MDYLIVISDKSPMLTTLHICVLLVGRLVQHSCSLSAYIDEITITLSFS